MPKLNVEACKLGKKPPVVDERTLKFSKYFRLTAAPPVENWTGNVKAWGMYDNDTVGDCVEAAAGHMVDLWDSYTNPGGPGVTTPQVIAAYSGATGYVPGKPDTDNGTDMLSFLKYWRKNGVGGHKIGAFVALEKGNIEQLKQAVWLFGAAFIGLEMPLSAQGEPAWYAPSSDPKGGAKPNSWGGHCVPVVAYQPSPMAKAEQNTVVTWGQLLHMADYFYEVYSDEAYAVLSTDWIAGMGTAQGVAPNQFDLAQLQADLAAL